MCQSLFFSKVADLFIKKEALADMFSCEFCEIFKNTFFIEYFWWLLLMAHIKLEAATTGIL